MPTACPKCRKDVGRNDTFCRNCGAKLKLMSIWKIITVVLMLLGVLFAIEIVIPQFFTDYHKKSPDSIAQSDLRNARTVLEAYWEDHKLYPEVLRTGDKEYPFQTSLGIHYSYEKSTKGEYRVLFSHQDGEKEYMSNSGDPAIYWRYKKDQTGKWQAL